MTKVNYDSLVNSSDEFEIVLAISCNDKEHLEYLVKYWGAIWLYDIPKFKWINGDSCVYVYVDLTKCKSDDPWFADWFGNGDRRIGLSKLFNEGRKNVKKDDIKPCSIKPIEIRGLSENKLGDLLKDYDLKDILDNCDIYDILKYLTEDVNFPVIDYLISKYELSGVLKDVGTDDLANYLFDRCDDLRKSILLPSLIEILTPARILKSVAEYIK